MTGRRSIRCLAWVLALFLLGAPTACNRVVYEHGPPSVQPRHHHDDYFYYPRAGVYFHILSGQYYYRANRKWRRARSLPRHIRLHPRGRVRMKIRDEKPYRHHDRHRRLHRPSRELQSTDRSDRNERRHNANRHRDYRDGRRDGRKRRRSRE